MHTLKLGLNNKYFFIKTQEKPLNILNEKN